MNITYNQATTILEAAKQKANELQAAVSIAVVDNGGHLFAFARLDSSYGLIDFAIKKARTAVMFGVDSDMIGMVVEGAGVQGAALINSNGGLLTIAGGVIIKDISGNIISAISSSGGTTEQDKEIAQVGAATYSLNKTLKLKNDKDSFYHRRIIRIWK